MNRPRIGMRYLILGMSEKVSMTQAEPMAVAR
jgi:hypothetical protein